ncbi:hypothetical protein [Streptomonospora litoralis]|uniref:Uncharacterized protein n=1 Tax=Streptomonospora litoralis TaxID=2498135 RepID=A0A4P6PUZ7_9ACTN|nr:hypothetical protein [Streptomonospora litoralis]QBI51978.1 hypothetical protein EKD16_00790 [Streptomonospora litoralis]
MLDPIPQHPYPSGLAVHDAAETSAEARTHGSARVVTHQPHSDGTFTYTVERLGEGTRSEWASYFTIPAGMWAMAGEDRAHDGGGRPDADSGGDGGDPAARSAGAGSADSERGAAAGWGLAPEPQPTSEWASPDRARPGWTPAEQGEWTPADRVPSDWSAQNDEASAR